MLSKISPVTTFLLASACVSWASAQEPAPPAKSNALSELYQVTVSPQSAPIPGFRYRLLPSESELTPGDAAPIYLRLPHEAGAERLRVLGEKPFEWLRQPLDRFPVSEARAYVDGWKSRLRQIEYGSRRRTCDWNYTLPEEKDHAFEILLPDAQQMRTWARLVALKARVEMAEGNLDESVRTIETGLAFSRHVAEGPFLINSLIGIALTRTMLERVDELISQPGAPNLYWALTALPRPLIGVHKSIETEVMMIDWIFPELGEVDHPKSPLDWSTLLARFHERMVSTLKKSGLIDSGVQTSVKLETDLGKFRSAHLPAAQAYLNSRARPLEGLPDDQVLMLFFQGRLREIRDDWSKPSYLPFAEAAPIYAAITRQYTEEKAGPLGLFVSLAPSIEASHAAEVRLDRKVAALRAVEAIRMQAASDGGKFPDSLDKVTVVPVPLDPSSGKSFAYRPEGAAMVLESGLIYEGHLGYQVIPRK